MAVTFPGDQVITSYAGDVLVPVTPHPLYLFTSAVHTHESWLRPACHPHHFHCTFPPVQFIPMSPGQTCMPPTPHSLHLSTSAVLNHESWLRPACHPHHIHCTFPPVQFIPMSPGSDLHATHTTSTAPFHQCSS